MVLTVAIFRLPGMVDPPDADWMAAEPDVTVRWVDGPAQLSGADLMLLPGSRDVLSDLHWLRQRGLAEVLAAHVGAKGATIGLAAGYEMLGERVEHGAEVTEGLGLLPVVTQVSAVEQRRSVVAEGISGLIGAWAKGEQLAATQLAGGACELGPGARPAFRVVSASGFPVDETDGCMDRGGWLFGTHLQGLFSNPSFRRRHLNALRARRGIAPLEP